MTLPPILYWSPSLAEHFNVMDGEHSMNGVIDATGDTVLYVWADWAWAALSSLPADAVRLVAEVVTS